MKKPLLSREEFHKRIDEIILSRLNQPTGANPDIDNLVKVAQEMKGGNGGNPTQ